MGCKVHVTNAKSMSMPTGRRPHHRRGDDDGDELALGKHERGCVLPAQRAQRRRGAVLLRPQRDLDRLARHLQRAAQHLAHAALVRILQCSMLLTNAFFIPYPSR